MKTICLPQHPSPRTPTEQSLFYDTIIAEPLAQLPSPCAALPEKGQYLTVSNGFLTSYPIYDAALLREDAEALLSH